MPALIDLTGQIFGDWTVMGRAPGVGTRWACRCTCGAIKSLASQTLREGQTLRCRECSRRVESYRGKTSRLDLAGQRFGRLVALAPAHVSDRSGRMWRCRCDCGNMRNVPSGSLRSGRTQSCGCLQRDRSRESVSGRLGAEMDDMQTVKLTISAPADWAAALKREAERRGVTLTELLVDPAIRRLPKSVTRSLSSRRGRGQPRKVAEAG